MAKATPASTRKKATKARKASVAELDADAASAAADADVEEALAGMEGAEVGRGAAPTSVSVGADGKASAPVRKPIVTGVPAPANAVLAEPERVKPEPVKDVAALVPAPPMQVGSRRQARLSLTGEFMVLCVTDPWERSYEKLKAGTFGGALLAAPLLELVMAGRLRVQRDRFQPVEGAPLPRALEDLAAAVQEVTDLPTLDAMAKLGRRELPELLIPWKLRLADAGIFALDPKNRIVQVVDPDAQGALENRLMRVLAGSGVVQAQDTLLLGLAMYAKLLPRFVPSSALAFNEKRIRALLGGRDTLDYRVDSGVRGLQELAVSTILGHVPALMGQ